MSQPGKFYVRFWGVRGSIAAPGPDTVRYGGNTSCLEVRCGGRLLVFDAGTGLRGLGRALASNAPIDADVFLTHTHFDHICGLPFFAPLYQPGNRIRMSAGHLAPELELKTVLVEMMMAPLFPIPPDRFRADVDYCDFSAGATLTPAPGITIRTAPLSHPDRATGYRIEYDGSAICYVTDTEHTPGQLDKNILSLIRDADIVIYDATYNDAEFAAFQGFGHSTWQEGVRLADAAGANTLVIFHHEPARTDDELDDIGGQAAALRPGTVVAYEGLVLEP
jgi:phosphoribosyl 1,2-cyclic phosphodiesterase